MPFFRNLFVITTTLAVLVAGPAFARPDTRTMTCEQTRELIQSRGAVVLTTGRNTYDRYVRQYGNQCDWPEVPLISYVQTRDGHCPVYRCQEPAFDFPG